MAISQATKWWWYGIEYRQRPGTDIVSAQVVREPTVRGQDSNDRRWRELMARIALGGFVAGLAVLCGFLLNAPVFYLLGVAVFVINFWVELGLQADHPDESTGAQSAMERRDRVGVEVSTSASRLAAAARGRVTVADVPGKWVSALVSGEVRGLSRRVIEWARADAELRSVRALNASLPDLDSAASENECDWLMRVRAGAEDLIDEAVASWASQGSSWAEED